MFLRFGLILIFAVLNSQCEMTILHDALYFNLTTTLRADVFVSQNQRQYAATTKQQEMHLNEFKTHYNARIEVLRYQEELLETKLTELENKLNPLELLNDIGDYCVQKYRSKIPIWTTVKTNFANCLQNANAVYPSLVSAPTTSWNNLKTYFSVTFANALKECKKKFALLESNYTTCVVAAVKTTTAVANTNMQSFSSQIKTAACQADLKVRGTFDCYANVLTTGLSAISETWTSVENCMSGHEVCLTCNEENALQKGRCPYQLSWHLAQNDLESDKITNPFKGISASTPCLQINFINKIKSVQLL